MLAFDDTGSGPPLVLIHGLAASREIWRHVVPGLPGRRVIAVDVPGFGASPAVGEGFDLEAVAHAIWDGLPVAGPVTVVGHSMGAAVALVAASLEPDRVRSLVLCAPAGLRPLPARATPVLGRLGAIAVDLRRRGAPLAASALGRRALLAAGTAAGDAVDEDDVVRMVTASEGATRVAEALEAVTTVDLRPVLRTVAAPVGVVWGDRDHVIPTSTLEVVRECRPSAAVEVVPRAGHIPMMERPAVFSAVLRQLLDRLGDVHTIATTAA